MRNTKKITMVMLAFGGIILTGCAHSTVDEQLNKKLTEEEGIKSRQDLQMEAAKEIKSSKLSEAQKAELQKLRDGIVAKENALWQQTLRLRAVLIKDMIAPVYNEPEIQAIQQRLRDTESQRLTYQFLAIDKANQILGHDFDHTEILNQFFDPGHTRF